MFVRFILIFGLVLLATAILWPVLTRLGLGRLPGDIVVERKNFKFYLPIMTSLVISAALSFMLSIAIWIGSRG